MRARRRDVQSSSTSPNAKDRRRPRSRRIGDGETRRAPWSSRYCVLNQPRVAAKARDTSEGTRRPLVYHQLERDRPAATEIEENRRWQDEENASDRLVECYIPVGAERRVGEKVDG